MGSVEFDPIVNRMSKRIGNFVYSSWKGRNVIKKYTAKKTDDPTPAQQKVRDSFKAVATIWKMLPKQLQKSWKSLADAKAITEFNAFLSVNSGNQTNGQPLVLTRSTGIENVLGCTAASAIAGSVTLSFTPTTDGRMLAIAVQKITDAIGEGNVTIQFDYPTNTGSAQIDGLESTSEYFLYFFTTDKVITEAAKISESMALSVTVS